MTDPEKHDWSQEGVTKARVRAQLELISKKIARASTPKEKLLAYTLYLKMVGVDALLLYDSLFPEAKSTDPNEVIKVVSFPKKKNR